MIEDKVAAIARTRLFCELDETHLRALAARAVERRLAPGEALFFAGEEARGLFVVVEGAMRAFRTGADGREQVLHVERAGASLGELPVFDDEPYPSTVAAEEASTLLFIEKRDVLKLCTEHPQIALAALRLLAGRLRRCAELVETLSLREVGQRVARFLLMEARSKGIHKDGSIEVALAQTTYQIAARVGSVREVVSRALTRLQADGLILIENRRLVVPDEARLAAYAGEK